MHVANQGSMNTCAHLCFVLRLLLRGITLRCLSKRRFQRRGPLPPASPPLLVPVVRPVPVPPEPVPPEPLAPDPGTESLSTITVNVPVLDLFHLLAATYVARSPVLTPFNKVGISNRFPSLRSINFVRALLS